MQYLAVSQRFLFLITGGSVLETLRNTSNLALRHCPHDPKCATHLSTATYVHKGVKGQTRRHEDTIGYTVLNEFKSKYRGEGKKRGDF